MPVLRLLKLHWPESRIHWWIDAGLAPLLEGDPDLAGVVPFHRKRWASPRYWPEMVRSIQWMRDQEFDYVIDLQCLARSGAFAWLARGKSLIGLDEVREGARGFYDIAARRASYHTHAVEWYLETLKVIGVPVHWNFTWIPERPATSAALRQRWKLDEFRWVVLQPGARWMNKRWPVEHFAALARQLAANDSKLRIAILGGAGDAPLGRVIREAVPGNSLDLTGKLTLPEMVEMIRSSALMVSNDTGPMHVASALRIPIIGLFGPTEPRRTGPYGQIERVVQVKLPCVPCMKPTCTNLIQLECLHRITPHDVARRAMALL